MTEQEMEELARGNIESNLSAFIDEGATPDDVYEEVYTLAFDALHDAGVDNETAGQVASKMGMGYAFP